MTGREKVLKALAHQEAEVPIDFGGTPVTSMHVDLIRRLRRHYALDDHPVKLLDPLQMLGAVEEDLKEALGVDTESIWGPYTLFGFRLRDWKPWRAPWGQELLVPGGFQTTTGDDGTTYLYPQGDTSVAPSGRLPQGGLYFDTIVRQEPIIEEELDPRDNLEEFTLLGSEEIGHFRREAQRLGSSTRFVVGSLTGDTGLGDIARVPGPMLKKTRGIRSEVEWYISTLNRQEYLHRVFEEQTDRAIVNLGRIREVVGDLIGAIFVCGTDFGTQGSLFCSPDHFDFLWTPYYKKVNRWVHANTNWRTFKHSCGAVEPLYSRFAAAGFDIVNPVQISAAGMEPSLLKKKHGSSLVFWGGGVDTQKTLPFGTPRQVREEVLKNVAVLSKGGGYVFNAVHNVQADTPAENFVAMIEAVHHFNGTT